MEPSDFEESNRKFYQKMISHYSGIQQIIILVILTDLQKDRQTDSENLFCFMRICKLLVSTVNEDDTETPTRTHTHTITCQQQTKRYFVQEPVYFSRLRMIWYNI